MQNKRYDRGRRRIRRAFTLMEIIVAMAVFTVMMTILLDFFIGTQKLWSGTDSKNELYADARVAMDLVSTTLQSAFYDHGSTMFLFGTANAKDDAVLFPVKMPMDYGSEEELYYLSLLWNKEQSGNKEEATLYLRTLGKKDSDEHYKSLFAVTTDATSRANKADHLRSWLGYANGGTNPSRKVVNGILSMKFRPIHASSGSVKFYTSGTLDSETAFNIHGTGEDVRELMPFGVQVSMQMLSKQHFQEWKTLGGTMAHMGTADEPEAAKAFRLANTRQFDRIIYLGFK